ncbi:MAG: hypothetical protein OXP09_07375 [Gammaproteobacteria bacterium]|nr:hypothetical protein [Gammaproteobacteria bacterium]MDE0365380.1 hypothetical protein [Gammaproteobacteria bacterium]
MLAKVLRLYLASDAELVHVACVWIFAEALQSGGDGPAMVVIPAGAFRMGCLSGNGSCFDHEKPVREVRIGQPFPLNYTTHV